MIIYKGSQQLRATCPVLYCAAGGSNSVFLCNFTRDVRSICCVAVALPQWTAYLNLLSRILAAVPRPATAASRKCRGTIGVSAEAIAAIKPGA